MQYERAGGVQKCRAEAGSAGRQVQPRVVERQQCRWQRVRWQQCERKRQYEQEPVQVAGREGGKVVEEKEAGVQCEE